MTEKRAILYARVSTKKQANGHGLDRQLDGLRIRAAFERMAVVGEFTDVISGAKPYEARSGLSDAMAVLADGRADYLLVEHPDRLARSLKESIRIQRKGESQGWSVRAWVSPEQVSMFPGFPNPTPMQTYAVVETMVSMVEKLYGGGEHLESIRAILDEKSGRGLEESDLEQLNDLVALAVGAVEDER